jgi:hypothetical protein
MASSYDEILNVFDDQGLGEVGIPGWSPDQIAAPVRQVIPREAPPEIPPARDVSLQGVALSAGLAGILLGLLFGRR